MKIWINKETGIRAETGFFKKLFRLIGRQFPRYSGAEISVALVSARTIKKLNKKYRHKNKVTDVLSFAERESKYKIAPRQYLGEIVISMPQAREQAREHKHALRRELVILLVHSFLHLVGFDHATDKQEKIMDKEARKVMLIYEKNL
ncbi:MAG: rRNA maturation RNase YbeY [Patescibacteria group bacterium]|jgi:probable rRNA maturation factor